jgi:molybdate transport system ATP-binding protein
VLALVGESGAGKTLTLRLLAGLERPDTGSVRVGGTVYSDAASGAWVPAFRRSVGYAPQEPTLFPHLGVFDNVAFGLRAQGLPVIEIQGRVEEALERFGLGDLRRRRPGQLSGGQQQRAALARAVVLRPDLLLMDEPLSALDTRARGSLRSELAAVLKGLDCATVYVTHDLEEARGLATRALMLEGGVAIRSGPPAQVL